MSKRIIYLFRNDLRIHDNEAFLKACREADELIPLYVFDPRSFRQTALNIRKTGVFRAAYLIECVKALRRELQGIGADLMVRIGEPESVIASLARDMDVSDVLMAKEIAFEETNVESSLSKQLKVINVDIEMIWMSTLCHPHDLPFWVSRLPDTFSLFRRAIEDNWKIRDLFPAPDVVKMSPELNPGEMPGLDKLDFGTDENASAALSHVRALALTIFDGDFFGEAGGDGESWDQALSAGLSAGRISPRQVYAGLQKIPDRRDERIGRWTDELIWRDYLQFTALRFGPRIFKLSGIRQDVNRSWRRDRAVFENWASGNTGKEAVDQAMKDLNATGWIPSGAREVAAVYLAEELEVAWIWGASYFESLLIDYDVCCSWGAWNYYAGVGR